jgi:hypothetical protein
VSLRKFGKFGIQGDFGVTFTGSGITKKNSTIMYCPYITGRFPKCGEAYTLRLELIRKRIS